ncbi:MAG: phytanoyl-CoA dioxygenase family protein [Saprospiraceae bacterium]
MLQRYFERYTGLMRAWKGTYVINNILNLRALRRNASLYSRYGLRKSILAPLSRADFPESHPDIPWLDRPDAERLLSAHSAFQAMTPDMQQKVRQFVREGYLVLENFFPKNDCEALNAEVDQLLKIGAVGFNYTRRKIFNLWEKSELARNGFFKKLELLEILSFLLGKPVIPFQSLNFVEGSEQRAHSDSIHMSTWPEGYLIAVWIALEEAGERNGALVYYPGSHRLPYLSGRDYPSGNTRFWIGAESNRRYEDKIAGLIDQHGLKPRVFRAQTGDALIWHANLIHGGLPIREADATRRSMVCHYYAEDAICYHEMSQRPAIIRTI